jgi:ParB-like chromosome segregation protein Spo0J
MIYRIEIWPIHRLIHDAQKPRLHPVAQIAQVTANMRRFGVVNPALVDRYENIIADGRILAASQLGLTRVPVVVLDHQSEGQARALRTADSKIVENTRWDDKAGHGRLTETKRNTNDKEKKCLK